MSPWLIGALAVGGGWWAGWTLHRWLHRGDAEQTQRNLLDLLAEQADTRERADARAIADNLDI
jgi:hypothetical protein